MNVSKILNLPKVKDAGTVVVTNGKVAATKVAYVDPFQDWVEDKDLDADIHVGIRLYVAMVNWQAENSDREIAGFGCVDDNAFMSFTVYTDSGNSGSVSFSNDSMMRAQMAAMENDPDSVINLHWHTHPDMGVFWSHTDKKQLIANFADMLKTFSEGQLYFIVFDGIYWLTKRVVYRDGKFHHNDGQVMLEDGGQQLPLHGTATMPIAAATYTWPKRNEGGLLDSNDHPYNIPFNGNGYYAPFDVGDDLPADLKAMYPMLDIIIRDHDEGDHQSMMRTWDMLDDMERDLLSELRYEIYSLCWDLDYGIDEEGDENVIELDQAV